MPNTNNAPAKTPKYPARVPRFMFDVTNGIIAFVKKANETDNAEIEAAIDKITIANDADDIKSTPLVILINVPIAREIIPIATEAANTPSIGSLAKDFIRPPSILIETPIISNKAAMSNKSPVEPPSESFLIANNPANKAKHTDIKPVSPLLN